MTEERDYELTDEEKKKVDRDHALIRWELEIMHALTKWRQGLNFRAQRLISSHDMTQLNIVVMERIKFGPAKEWSWDDSSDPDDLPPEGP